jgi:alpha-glucosidase
VRAVLVNFTARPVTAGMSGPWQVEVASDGAGEGEPYRGEHAPEQAVVLRAARAAGG